MTLTANVFKINYWPITQFHNCNSNTLNYAFKQHKYTFNILNHFTSFNGTARPSGVRFRNLPYGEGTILVVDEQGYVYDSKIPTHVILQEEREKNEQLMEQVNELSKKLEALNAEVEKLNGEKSEQDESEFTIFPNPNSGNFMVKHLIHPNTENAYLLITNQDGKQIMKKEITCVGLCTSSINLAENVSNGTYFCSLFIDGKLKSTDRFIYRR